MFRYFRIAVALFATFFFALLANAASKKLPDWVKEALELPAPPRHEGEKPTWEVVWDEAHYTVLSNGRIEKKVQYAIRILDMKERWRARAGASYYASSGTKPKITAWTIHDDGDVHKYKRSDEEERSNSSYLTLETESRYVSVSGWNHTRKGDVFAFESSSTESTVFTQYYWRFQNSAPVAHSRLTISAPEGWNVQGNYFFGTPRQSQANGQTTWSATNVYSKSREPYSPSSASQVQHMIAVVEPPENSKLRFTNLSFKTWKDLAEFKADVSDPQAIPTSEIIAKAKEITKGASTKWEKIKSLGEYAQSINYEHVALDIGNGGGYTPRSASETFRSGYGDCKDKSTLLRALLKAVDIDSYVVSLDATDNDSVDATFPGPFYFNHCITAVEIDDSIETPAVYEDDDLGRLLFIDPTWNNSPIGEIPFEAQGGLVVIGKRNVDPLVRLPLTSPEQNKIKRTLLVEILPNGSVLGKVDTVLYGQSAVNERQKISSYSRNEYIEYLNERFSGGGNPSPFVGLIEESDEAKSDRTYRNTIEFAFKGYAKQMQNVLMIFKPAILGRVVDNPFSKIERKLPVRLRSKMLEETVKIYTPEGYVADEYEAEILIENDFGSYRSTVQVADGEVLYTRAFIVQDMILPVDRYGELRDFYAKVVQAEQTPVVLSRNVQ